MDKIGWGVIHVKQMSLNCLQFHDLQNTLISLNTRRHNVHKLQLRQEFYTFDRRRKLGILGESELETSVTKQKSCKVTGTQYLKEKNKFYTTTKGKSEYCFFFLSSGNTDQNILKLRQQSLLDPIHKTNGFLTSFSSQCLFHLVHGWSFT